MALFDEIGKKITQTSQGVVQKTKDTSETLRLSGLISDEEKRVNGFYLNLGKAYYNLNSEAPQTDLIPLVTSIRESLNKIAQYNEQIKTIKGMVRCTKCGGECPNGAVFCSSCGSSLSIASPSDQVGGASYCHQCSAPLSPKALFCTKCGTRVEATPIEPPATPAAPPEISGSTCPQCNARVSPGLPFCTECGNRLEAGSAVLEERPELTTEAQEPLAEVQVSLSEAAAGSDAVACPTCGMSLSPDLAFCLGCGRKMD